jgi:hypothetical protein
MSKLERIITFALIAAASIVAVVNWRRAALFQADNEQLRAKIVAIESEADANTRATSASTQELEILKQRSAELMKLRNEVTQLRAGSQTAQSTAAENQRLKAEIQQLRARAADAPAPTASSNQFSRESWRFAGYASPEAGLVSALWAMKEGNPQTYLDSLSPTEQQRAAVNWQNMSQEEIAAKHQSDVANISGLRVIERESIAPDEVLMNVYLEGPGRMEKIRMNQVGGEWKFSGFPPPPTPDAPVPAPQP